VLLGFLHSKGGGLPVATCVKVRKVLAAIRSAAILAADVRSISGLLTIGIESLDG
jgi:hypothetical protein